MKKAFFLPLIICFSALIVYAGRSNFSDSLKNCSYYSESGNVNTEGMDVASTKQILGWKDNKCVYRESVDFLGTTTVITCKLTRPQIDEFCSVIDAYELVNKYSKENVDTSNLTAVQDNPVIKVWNKFLNDKATCSVDIAK